MQKPSCIYQNTKKKNEYIHNLKKTITTLFTESVKVPRDGNFQSLDKFMNIYQLQAVHYIHLNQGNKIQTHIVTYTPTEQGSQEGTLYVCYPKNGRSMTEQLKMIQ